MEDNDLKVVRFTNISNFDFTPEMGAMYGGRPFFVKAGDSLLTPWTIGDHLATHLARQIILKKAPIRDEKEIDGKGSDRSLWDDTAIEDLKKKILVEAYTETAAPVVSELDRMTQKVEELNKTPETQVTTEGSVYKDKAEVIAELTKRGVKFNTRASKAELEALLTQ